MDTALTEQAIALWLEHQRERLSQHFSFPVLSISITASADGAQYTAHVGHVNMPSHQVGIGKSPFEAVSAAMKRSIEVVSSLYPK